MRIKLLVDNNSKGGLIEEHGFSAWVEIGGCKILFDTGQGKALVPNAAMMGCDLSELDALVLSHGHYDHCGAISQLLKINPEIHVYCHSAALCYRYSIKSGESARDISVPRAELEALLGVPGNRMHWINGAGKIRASVGITGIIDRLHPLEDTGGPFFLDQVRQTPDPIWDDMSIWIKTRKGLIIITGCCHSGLINSVRHIRRVSGVDRIFGVIGGLHLVNASRERLEATCSAIRKWNPDFVIPCHCTGEKAIAFLRDELGTIVTPGYAGLELQPMG
ncbi:MAG: hypothetical protein A2X85_16960 [Geobacteraceae bacterium GWF2_54_21]|nr:MAG: hypothetical protein A2X85_16960 [Geobacteraceae bacterium GWF2_54_21]HBA73650.1 MBL fold metallo-hydrolase [Geobacter sp.]